MLGRHLRAHSQTLVCARLEGKRKRDLLRVQTQHETVGVLEAVESSRLSSRGTGPVEMNG